MLNYIWIVLVSVVTSGDLFSQATLENHYLPTNSYKNNFSMIEEESLEAFEAEIAYFFGVADKRPVVQAYIDALRRLEVIGYNCSTFTYDQEIIPYLESAYRSVAEQRNWHFNTHMAAQIELEIILSNFNNSSFEAVKNLMIQLYTLVFQSYTPKIEKAAMLRTFLYQYKTEVLKREVGLSPQDQQLMLEIANTSKKFLNSIR